MQSSCAARLQVFSQEGLRIGMCHGDVVVPRGNEHARHALRRRMGVDVLLTANTGSASYVASSEGLLIDPGSITGAAVSPLSTGQPSYTLMILDSGKVCRSGARAYVSVSVRFEWRLRSC